MLFPDAREESGGQETPVGKTAPQLVDEDFGAPLARCFFDEPNDRLKVRAEADLVGWWFASKGRQTAQGRHTRQAKGRGARDPLEKLPSCFVHVSAPLGRTPGKGIGSAASDRTRSTVPS